MTTFTRAQRANVALQSLWLLVAQHMTVAEFVPGEGMWDKTETYMELGRQYYEILNRSEVQVAEVLAEVVDESWATRDRVLWFRYCLKAYDTGTTPGWAPGWGVSEAVSKSVADPIETW